MAIYSCNHNFVGKSKHAAGTSAAHVRYITRPSAEAHVMAQRMPANRNAAMNWMNTQETSSRKNERMIDKIMGALPVELSRDQQEELVRDFAEGMTEGRAPWFAALHRDGEDAHNPHMHLVIRDRDQATGKKVAQLSSKGSTAQIRERWEYHVNAALERAGISERVDRRSLKDQGIEDRQPTIHIGPRVQGMAAKGYKPQGCAPIVYMPIGPGKDRADKARRMEAYRVVPRSDYNAKIIDLNAERRKRQQQAHTQIIQKAYRGPHRSADEAGVDMKPPKKQRAPEPPTERAKHNQTTKVAAQAQDAGNLTSKIAATGQHTDARNQEQRAALESHLLHEDIDADRRRQREILKLEAELKARNAVWKSALTQQQQQLDARLRAVGLKKLMRDIAGKTQADEQARLDVLQNLAGVARREAEEKAVLQARHDQEKARAAQLAQDRQQSFAARQETGKEQKIATVRDQGTQGQQTKQPSNDRQAPAWHRPAPPEQQNSPRAQAFDKAAQKPPERQKGALTDEQRKAAEIEKFVAQLKEKREKRQRDGPKRGR